MVTFSKDELSRVYTVTWTKTEDWCMDAPLSTIREVFRLRGEAVQRILVNGNEPVKLHGANVTVVLKS